MACEVLRRRDDTVADAAAILRRAMTGDIPQRDAIAEALAVLEGGT